MFTNGVALDRYFETENDVIWVTSQVEIVGSRLILRHLLVYSATSALAKIGTRAVRRIFRLLIDAAHEQGLREYYLEGERVYPDKPARIYLKKWEVAMKHYSAPPIDPEIVQAMGRLVDAGTTPKELISKMREAGLSIVPSIRLLEQFFQMAVPDAKRMVHLSDTWADCRSANDKLHEATYQAAIDEGFEVIEIGQPETVAAH